MSYKFVIEGSDLFYFEKDRLSDNIYVKYMLDFSTMINFHFLIFSYYCFINTLVTTRIVTHVLKVSLLFIFLVEHNCKKKWILKSITKYLAT
jgi:hypothetical protein